MNAARQTGSVLGVAAFGSLIASRRHFIGGLHAALLVSIALILVAMLLSGRIKQANPEVP